LTPDKIESLALDWIAGNVTILIDDGNEIRLSEKAAAPIPEDAALRYGVQNGTLYVQYCPQNARGRLPEKELIVTIPRALADNMASFSYDASSASLLVNDIVAQSFHFDSSSGNLEAASIRADTVKLNASSGDIRFSGEYAKTQRGHQLRQSNAGEPWQCGFHRDQTPSSGDVHISGNMGDLTVDTTSGMISSFGALTAASLNADTSSGTVNLAGSFDNARVGTTSGTVSLAFTACPQKLDVETSSGDVTLSLPRESGFTLRYDTSSGEMDCDFAVVMDGKKVCGRRRLRAIERGYLKRQPHG